MKIAPLTRYSGAVGSVIVSEVAVRVGLSAEACAAGPSPSIGRAARIRAEVQKRCVAASWEAIETAGIAAPAAGTASAPMARAAAVTSVIRGRNGRIRMGTQADGEAMVLPFRDLRARRYPAQARITCRDARPRGDQSRTRRADAAARPLGPRPDRQGPRPWHQGRGIRLPA